MPQTPLIQVRNLSRRDARTNRLILDNVSLEICAGQRIGLIGPTGSGKSSLLRAIAMLDHCDGGDVHDQGRPVGGNAVPAYRRRAIYLPQRSEFVVGTVLDNLELPFRFESSRGRLDQTQVRHWLDEMGKSGDMLHQSVEVLSGGEQQIVALIRAMALSPDVLLLDEPTASLDPESTEKFERLVAQWNDGAGAEPESRRAYVWTSHDADQVGRMTTRVIAIRDGALLGD